MAEKEKNSVGTVQAGTIRVIEPEKPLELECGKKLAPVDVAYETYGKLNEGGDNVILICHALSGNARVASMNSPDDSKPGWWDAMVGPDKGIDTNKYFVICSNFLGGCSGTTGPTDSSNIQPINSSASNCSGGRSNVSDVDAELVSSTVSPGPRTTGSAFCSRGPATLT